MMTSTYPSARSNSHHDIRNGLKELQTKKDALLSLESALKKRINELRELCLKEGELIGHLPVDYPLQPREPIPQVRRRTNHSSSGLTSNNNNNNVCESSNGIIPPNPSRQKPQQQQIPSVPSRPMSTNSTSSSLSTASSNIRNAQQMSTSNYLIQASSSSRSNGYNHHTQPNIATGNSNALNMLNNHNNGTINDSQHIRYDQPILPNQFKRPNNLASIVQANFDSDTIGSTRASSTASSSSSFGSGASSTISAPVMPTTGFKSSNCLDMTNLHGRSYSESLSIDDQTPFKQINGLSITRREVVQSGGNIYDEPNANLNHSKTSCAPPPRPPRGLTHFNRNQLHSSIDTVDGVVKARQRNLLATTEPESNKLSESSNIIQQRRPIDVSSLVPPSAQQRFNMSEIKTSIQPYYEETKPFQMADFYKYSSKHRQQNPNQLSDCQKTTYQLQQDAAMRKNHYSNKYPYDDQLHSSVRLIEKSGQKLMKATARAIAANPGLAEKINSILPTNTNNDDNY